MKRAQAGPCLYVPNHVSNTVSVIDTIINTTTPPNIPVGSFPESAAVRGDGALVYVTNQNAGAVSVINTATNMVVTNIAPGGPDINANPGPIKVAISPDGTRPSVTRDQRTASNYTFGVVCPKQGKGATLILPACSTEAMNLHLTEIAEMVAPGARASIGRYLDFYNGRRPHSNLDGTTPDQAYFTALSLRMAA